MTNLIVPHVATLARAGDQHHKIISALNSAGYIVLPSALKGRLLRRVIVPSQAVQYARAG